MYKSIVNHSKSAEINSLIQLKGTKKFNYLVCHWGATAKVVSILILFFNLNYLSAQDSIFENGDDSLFYQNPPLPEITMKAIVRFENKAKVKLKVNNLLVSDIVGYIDNDGNYFNSNIIETDSTILLTNLALNKTYNVVLNHGTPNQFFLTDVNTFSQQGNPIYLSDVFLEKVDLWTSQEESNPTLPILYHYLKEMNELDNYEKLYFFQRMYKDSLQVFSSSISEDLYIDHGQLDWTKFGPIETWNPNTTNPCRCNYALNIATKINPGYRNFDDKKNEPLDINHGRQYFGNGPDVYSHLDEKGNGPAQHHKFKLRVSKVGVGEKTSNSGSALNSTNVVNSIGQVSAAYKSQLVFKLVCDRPIYGGALPEACKCEKKIKIYYRYDAKLMADARSLSCLLCNEKGAAVTIEDWTLVSVQQGSTFTVLGAGKGESKAQCNDVGFIGSATNIISTAAVFAATATTAVAAPTPSTVTAAATAFTNFMNANLNVLSPNNQSCGTAGSNPPYNTLVDGSRTLTLKTNEEMIITMSNTHFIQTKAKRAGEAKAEKISNYYLAAVIPQNTTQNEFDYCCSKKIAAFNLGSFDGAPLNLLQTQDELGFYLGLNGPWYAPYNVRNPRNGGVLIPFEVDMLAGNSGCDMVEVSYRKDNNKPNGNSNLINLKTDNNSFVIQNLSTSKMDENKKTYSVNIYDLTGKVLYSQNNVTENEINKFSETIPYNQILILNITNQYENKSYKFIRQ